MKLLSQGTFCYFNNVDLLLLDHGKRKADLNGDIDQIEPKKIRVPIDIPISCLTSRVETPSDIELLTRLFPNQHRYLLEMILQGCYGNILHAIQVITKSSSLPSSSSDATAPSQPPFTTSSQPPTGSKPPPSVNYGGLLGNAYRYLYPGIMPPPSYLFPGSPGLSYFRPYFPNYTPTSTPIQLNSGNQSNQRPLDEDMPTPANYKQEYNSLDMTPSPSPQREETEIVCQKCNHKQKNDKICERCGQNNQLIENNGEICS